MMISILLIWLILYQDQSCVLATEDLVANDVVFSSPDLSLDYATDEGTIHLDAFKSPSNDQIIADKSPSQYGALRWSAIGQPRIVQKNYGKKYPAMFHFTNESATFYFEMLSLKDKEMLKREVKRTKGINVGVESFTNLKANSIECNVTIYDTVATQNVVLHGKVTDFATSPYRISLNYVVDSRERIILEANVLNNETLDFTCTLTSGKEINNVETFTIPLDEVQALKLEEKLFTNATRDYIYVTRGQLMRLASEVNMYYDAVHDYVIGARDFGVAFAESLSVLCGEQIGLVLFEHALPVLSMYSLGFIGRLKMGQYKNYT